MSDTLYPLLLGRTCCPGHKPGELLGAYLREEAPDAPAEGAECVLVPADGETAVQNGPSAGATLAEIARREPASMLGRRYGVDDVFPLHLRIVETDAQQPLQVCPESSKVPIPGRATPSNSLFWFSLGGARGSRVTTGIKQRVTRTRLVSQLNSEALGELLEVFPAPFGDAFFIPAGNVFSAGPGNLLLELRPSVCERAVVSGWGVDPEHVDPEHALKPVRVASRHMSRIRRDVRGARHTRKIPLVPVCPDFLVDEVRVVDYFFDRTAGACFHLLCPVKGAVRVESAGSRADVPSGMACFLPASLGDYRVYPSSDTAIFLRITPQVPVV